ncbi:DNA sulfur modification protein DndB [Cyclobacterium amurskyense]|uniref:DNA sulfur modification protein DndB n=1 Tax=Cyclobacterium amurskyense TaxID=320787 RepID=UPI0030DDC0A3|tara:strand:+ start:8850 stop:10064 length:1215 start_codon:yes stop_codon:yes gene_type:complete
MNNSIKLPSLRGRMGDWFYYVSLLKFKELAKRTSLVPEIHKNEELSRWIQREVSNRSEGIMQYLENQPQRFFNAIICGIYGGAPSWQELDIESNAVELSEEEKIYLGKTFGILTLNGDEKIFAIDGQHRTNAIKQFIDKNGDVEEEVTVIFLAHKNDREGEVRTRRLFSTLNRYAVPVKISEIIALDEDDNGAILTRWLMEDFDYFNDRIQFTKTRSMNQGNKSHFSNIVLLYDLVNIILTDKTFSKNVKLKGYDFKTFTSKRQDEPTLNEQFENLKEYFELIFNSIPSVKNYFENGIVNRKSNDTSLLFRPIGQMILFYTLKIAKANNKEDEMIRFYGKDDFNLSHIVWKQVFIDQEKGTLKTDKPRQTLAIQLICKKIGINLSMTNSEKSFMENFNIDINLI